MSNLKLNASEVLTYLKCGEFYRRQYINKELNSFNKYDAIKGILRTCINLYIENPDIDCSDMYRVIYDALARYESIYPIMDDGSVNDIVKICKILIPKLFSEIKMIDIDSYIIIDINHSKNKYKSDLVIGMDILNSDIDHNSYKYVYLLTILMGTYSLYWETIKKDRLTNSLLKAKITEKNVSTAVRLGLFTQAHPDSQACSKSYCKFFSTCKYKGD